MTILDIKDVKEDETKENVAKAIVDFLMTPSGKTIAEVEKENPVEDEVDEEEIDEEEEEEEEQVKPKGSPRKGKDDKNQAGRPKRATATRVWTKGEEKSELDFNFLRILSGNKLVKWDYKLFKLINYQTKSQLINNLILDYGSSEEEEEEVEEERPKVGRKRKNDSDSGSDVSIRYNAIDFVSLSW